MSDTNAQHPDVEALWASAEGRNVSGVDAHVADCEECRATRDAILSQIGMLSDPDLYVLVDDQQNAADFAVLRAARYGQRLAALEVLKRVQSLPVEAWPAAFGGAAIEAAPGLVEVLLAIAEEALDGQPARARAIIDLAERYAWRLQQSDARRALGDVYTQRGNLHRNLGEYARALEFVDVAADFYRSLRACDFDLARTEYVRATIHVKSGNYASGERHLNSALSVLQDYGETVSLLRARSLRAAIALLSGDIAEAHDEWESLIGMSERLGNRVELARTRANLVECELWRGDLGSALAHAKEAMRHYLDLGMDSECNRSKWTVAAVLLRAGESEDGLRQLFEVAATFELMGMNGDAAYVRLDITAELLRRGEWVAASKMAGELVTFFSTAGAPAVSVVAIEGLRLAVERREATVDLVRHVKETLQVPGAPTPARNSPADPEPLN